MTIQCKRVLKGLRKLTHNSEESLAFLGGHNCIVLQSDYDTGYDYSKDEKEIHGIIETLSENGYINHVSDANFSLTHKALHLHWFAWEAVKHFLFHSIFVPIVVAFLTSIATSLLIQLLQWP